MDLDLGAQEGDEFPSGQSAHVVANEILTNKFAFALGQPEVLDDAAGHIRQIAFVVLRLDVQDFERPTRSDAECLAAA